MNETSVVSPPPTRTEALAHELAQMAAFATRQDHLTSPIVDAIRKEATSRPFGGAIRTLVTKLAQDADVVPRQSIVLTLIEECDLDVAFKLGLLREFLLTRPDPHWTWGRRDDVNLALERDGLISVLFRVVLGGGRAGMDVLVGWCAEQRVTLRGGWALGDVADSLLVILAERDVSAVLEALGDVSCMGAAASTLSRLAMLYPDDALAFARRARDKRQYEASSVALMSVASVSPARPEVREIATPIAYAPEAHGCRSYALKALLRVPPVAPEIWAMMHDLPEIAQIDVPRYLVPAIREGLTEPLEVLESWIRNPSRAGWMAREGCIAYGMALEFEGGRSLDMERERRLVEGLIGCVRLGASDSVVGYAVKSALEARSDAEYETLGGEALVRAAIEAGPHSRVWLVRGLASPDVRRVAWPGRAVDLVVDASDAAENVSHACEMVGDACEPDEWTESVVECLLAGYRPDDFDAVPILRRMLPCNRLCEGPRQILAWFAREFPEDARFRRALRHVMQGTTERIWADLA